MLKNQKKNACEMEMIEWDIASQTERVVDSAFGKRPVFSTSYE